MGARKLFEERILELIKNIPEEDLPKVISLLETRASQLNTVRDLCGKYSDVATSSEAFSKRKEDEKHLDK